MSHAGPVKGLKVGAEYHSHDSHEIIIEIAGILFKRRMRIPSFVESLLMHLEMTIDFRLNVTCMQTYSGDYNWTGKIYIAIESWEFRVVLSTNHKCIMGKIVKIERMTYSSENV